MACCCLSVLAYVALFVVLLRLLFRLSDLLYPHVLAPLLGKVPNLKEYCGGTWAVVTGATDGIGKGYAKELAKQGYSLILISRNQEKLDATAAEIKALDPSGEVETIQFDFRAGEASDYDRVRERLEGVDVGILVNNVGVSVDCPDPMHLTPVERARDIVTVNDLSCVMMCQMVMGKLVEKGKGAVINVASGSAINPAPFFSIYGGSKAFVEHMTEGMQLEYADSGVFIQVVIPFFVATKMSKIRNSSFLIPDPDTFARSALRTVGLQKRSFGCLGHALQGFLVAVLPAPLLGMLTVKYMKDLQLKAKRRQAAKKD